MRVKHDLLERRQHESRGTAARAALTVFSATDGRGKQNYCLTSHRKKLEEHFEQKGVNNPEIRILESEPWLVKTTGTILIPSRVNQMLVGRVEFPKRQKTPPLVCVEPAQLPHEGVLAARGLSRVLTSSARIDERRDASDVTRRVREPAV